MNKECVFKSKDKDEGIVWQSTPEGRAMVEPWFMSDILSLIPNAIVVGSSSSYLSISDEKNYMREFCIFFDDLLFVYHMYEENLNLITRKDIFTFEGFCRRHGFQCVEQFHYKDEKYNQLPEEAAE
jgi:hypothetical protein|tara:strand:+ start:214 stop:591 length:378 start_codon:yes stop_codon:yes gene_type:complete